MYHTDPWKLTAFMTNILSNIVILYIELNVYFYFTRTCVQTSGHEVNSRWEGPKPSNYYLFLVTMYICSLELFYWKNWIMFFYHLIQWKAKCIFYAHDMLWALNRLNMSTIFLETSSLLVWKSYPLLFLFLPGAFLSIVMFTCLCTLVHSFQRH